MLGILKDLDGQPVPGAGGLELTEGWATLGVAQIAGEGLRDATVLELAERVELSERAAFNDLFPAERWAEVELELTGGRVLASKPLTARGDADAPLSDAEISSKFHALMDEAGYGDRATRIEDMIMAGDATPATVSDLVACCSASS